MRPLSGTSRAVNYLAFVQLASIRLWRALMSPRRSQPSRGNDIIVPMILPDASNGFGKIGGLRWPLPVTLHGVVFDILFWRSTKHQAEPDLIMLL
jgi:hypothetical protein